MHSIATVLTFLAVVAVSFERTSIGVLLGGAALFICWH
jgi:hypothetical protein